MKSEKRITVTQWLRKWKCFEKGAARGRYIERAASAKKDGVTGRITVAENEPNPKLKGGVKWKRLNT